MPSSPTPRLNVPSGNEHAPAVVEACREQGCMSTRSLAPAASTSGLEASTASAGSFWEFCGCWLVGLPTLTRAWVACAPAGDTPAPNPTMTTALRRPTSGRLMGDRRMTTLPSARPKRGGLGSPVTSYHCSVDGSDRAGELVA